MLAGQQLLRRRTRKSGMCARGVGPRLERDKKNLLVWLLERRTAYWGRGWTDCWTGGCEAVSPDCAAELAGEGEVEVEGEQ